MRFAGKTALVTGASGGIGRAVVAALRAEGATVAAADLDVSSAEADHALPGNLINATYCDALPARATEAMGGLDILVNNAGIIRRGRITEATGEDYRLSMAVNVEAPFRLCRAAIPIMAARGGGAIVNTASCWGIYPGPDHPLYCMSKAALTSLTRCLGRDHARDGIRINAVCPNEVDTPMLRSGFALRGYDPETAVADLDKTVPLGRVAQPEDIADVICFLASDAARYLCGVLIEANGGKPVG